MRGELRRLLVIDGIVSLMGFAYYTVFIAAMFELTGRTADVGIIAAATVLPSLLIVLTAGRFMARFSARRTVSMFTVARVVAFVVAVFVPETMASLLVITALNSLIQQAVRGAKRTLDAERLQPEERRPYNAKRTMLGNLVLIAGPALGGLGITMLGLTWCLIIGAVANVVIVIAMSSLSSRDEEVKATADSGASASATASLHHLRTVPVVLSMIAMYCLVVVILEVESPLMFPFVKEVYQLDGQFVGTLLGLGGLGGIVGAYLAKRYPKVFTESSLSLMIVFDGIVFLTFTQVHDMYVACALFTLMGMMGAVAVVLIEEAVQEHVHAVHRPFVFSVMQFAAGAGGATLGILAAVIAGSVGSKLVLAWCGGAEIVMGLACALIWWAARARARTREPVTLHSTDKDPEPVTRTE
ncbi:MFS transporter [Streptomyces sp. N2-109]|uniref:MFS transporter n=1 Tax=Streptomyces gossypii TaxID=2883101 RepID=A0ABT2JP43_9ACTN|nr:MFS transporter [Streptomyces gossypii]MCT2589643.1 MFS transporter [Streptomyces gossypii]